MTDRLHDHLTFGFRRGCVACAQTEADIARLKRVDVNAVGEALFERVMEGDPEAVPAYSRWMARNHWASSEGAAALRV